MARLRSNKLGWLLVVCAGLAAALEVAPGSSCASFCLDEGESDSYDPASSSTNSTEISCRDDDFATEGDGIKFKNCLECLSKSGKVHEDESDSHWYLYNLRFALSTCLFSTPGPSSDSQIDSPCIIDHACRPLEKPLTSDGLDDTSTDTYAYCDASDNDVFTQKGLWSCLDCLRASNDQKYLANFVTALQAGCEQKPDPGTLLSLSGTVFTSKPVNITEPPIDITKEPEGAGSDTLTVGAIAGMVVGIVLFLALGISLLVLYFRKQKRAARHEKEDAYRRGSGSGNGSLSGTPDPILPPDGNEMTASIRSYTPQNGTRSHHAKGPSMTSGEYYDKLEEEITVTRLHYNFDPRSRNRAPNGAVPSHQAYIPQAVSRLKSGDSTSSSTRTASPSRGHARSHTTGSTAMSYPVETPPAADGVDGAAMPAMPPPASRRAASVDHGPGNLPPPPPGPPPKHRKTPSLSMPSIRKMKRPKQYAPPNVDGDESAGNDMHISQPVMNHEARFQDRPLKGGPVFAQEGQLPDRSGVAPYTEVPIKSGNSTLYG